MPPAIPTGRLEDLSWLLTGLIERVPHATSGLLLSSDGLVKAAEGLETEDAEHLAAVASGLSSLARGAGVKFRGGDLRKLVVQMDTARLFVTAAGEGACLAVLAAPEVDAEVLGYEMAMLVKSARRHLSTPARQAEGTAG